MSPVASSGKLLVHKIVMSPLALDNMVPSSISRGRADQLDYAFLRKSSGDT